MVKGLWISSKGIWAGDVDLNDGKLKQQQKNCHDRIHWCEHIGLANQNSVQVKLDLIAALKDLEGDLNFIHTGK